VKEIRGRKRRMRRAKREIFMEEDDEEN